MLRFPVLGFAILLAACGTEATPQVPAAAAIDACLLSDDFIEPEATVDLCTIALNAKPKLQGHDRVDVLVHRGVALRNAGQLGRSRIDLERAVKLADDDDSALRMLAWTYRELGDYSRADRLYSEALAINDEWQGRLSRCVVRGYGHGRWEEALEDCRRALVLKPTDDSYFFSVSALNALGRYEEAARIASEGVKREDATERLYEELEAARNGLGDMAGAAAVKDEARQRFGAMPSAE